MNTPRPDFFEPQPKMPVYRIDVIVYNNGEKMTLYEDQLLELIREEIENIFREYGSEKQFMVAYEVGEYETELSIGYVDLHGNERAIPKEWLDKTIVCGKNVEYKLIGDRIPINVLGYPNIEVQFLDY
jgi:hypothetical protein